MGSICTHVFNLSLQEAKNTRTNWVSHSKQKQRSGPGVAVIRASNDQRRIIFALSGKARWSFTHDCDFLQTDRCSFSINSSSQQKPSSLVFLGFFFFTIVKTDCADHISAALMFMANVVRTWSLLLWHCRHSVPIKIHLVEAHVGTRLGPVGDSCGFPMFQVYQRLRH